MNWFWDLNLIHCFDYYLMLIFVIGVVVRVRQYRALLGLIWSVSGRWPHLLRLVNLHRSLLLTWGTVWPALLALLLSLTHMLACRLVWPHVDVTVSQLTEWWPAGLAISLLGVLMIGFDCDSAFRFDKWNRAEVEKQFDQAEFWLTSWTAPAVRVFTLGFVHPRKLVGVEVRNVLVEAVRQLNLSLWWSSLQVGLRIAFGASLWLTYIGLILPITDHPLDYLSLDVSIKLLSPLQP